MAVILSKEDLQLKQQITERLKQLRESTGKSQVDFAYDLGLDKQAVNRIEKGNGATIYTISKYCKYFEITLKEFFDSELFK
ncbi:helix-turn-helix domain-containing protein [Paraflavitalea pollutisoli]|uniref:helix-turn-helix domain-containing protein n=1 Tax=Paraflavitalea pollutisoli TaxID=3034143 RepID=UPI0023EAF1B4|nr:helix-turn-helix transcriptional regulator [Paraflavitalea sp. H1-2-19X]